MFNAANQFTSTTALVKFLRQFDVFFFYAAASWRRSW
ncbi:hypothetical protein RCH23_002742 [Cryobacterium sp. CAN_C3]|nr:hypothetical protein [Cryobacterium sp. CAN_C3]